jgi:hypothetical protein
MWVGQGAIRKTILLETTELPLFFLWEMRLML